MVPPRARDALETCPPSRYTKAWATPGAPPTNATLRDYVEAAKAHVEGRVGGMLVLSDDLDIIDALPDVAAAAGVRLFTVAPGRPLVSTSRVANSSLGDIDCERGGNVHSRHHKRITDQCRTGGFNYRLHPDTGQEIGSEEMYQFLTAWYLLARCSVLVGMGQRSYFSELIFSMMCAMDGTCPKKIDIHFPDAVADDGDCHVLDRASEPEPPLAEWRALELPDAAYVNGGEWDPSYTQRPLPKVLSKAPPSRTPPRTHA